MPKRRNKPLTLGDVPAILLGMTFFGWAALYGLSKLVIKYAPTLETIRLIVWGAAALFAAYLGLAWHGRIVMVEEKRRAKVEKKRKREQREEARKVKAIQKQLELCEAKQLHKLLQLAKAKAETETEE